MTIRKGNVAHESGEEPLPYLFWNFGSDGFRSEGDELEGVYVGIVQPETEAHRFPDKLSQVAAFVLPTDDVPDRIAANRGTILESEA